LGQVAGGEKKHQQGWEKTEDYLMGGNLSRKKNKKRSSGPVQENMRKNFIKKLLASP